MTRESSSSAARCAEMLLAFVRRGVGRRLSKSEQQTRREEVNRLLEGLDHDVIDNALEKLFRIAEREARLRAQRLSAALNQSDQTRSSAAFHKRTT